jgi:hypothetical protein
MVPSSLGSKSPVLGLLATGCLYALATEAALPGSGLFADSKNAVNLSFGALSAPTAAGASTAPAPGVASASPQVIGWIEEALPPAGRVRTIPKNAEVGFAGARFAVKDLPVYPGALGSDLPAAVVIGRKITDFFALAWDPAAGKLYVKQVLFAK